MAVRGTNCLTLLDHAKRMDPDGKIAAVVELLSETNEILDDMLWLEGNLPTGHRTTVRTTMPASTWRKLNYGVQPTKSTTAQVDDTCGMLEQYAEVDKDLAMLNGNTAEFRLSEDRAHLDAMNQDFADTLIYNDTDEYPERFLGLAPRFATLATSNVINAGGTGSDLSSIWVVVWGSNTVHGIFPKGSKAGIISQDLGEVTLTDAAGGRYQGFRTHYQMKPGLCVRDWRYIVRICNVESAVSMSGSTTNGLAAVNPLIYALNLIPNLRLGKPVIYCNKDLKTQFDILAANKSNVFYTEKDPFGRPVTYFQGYPVRKVDAILSTETALT